MLCLLQVDWLWPEGEINWRDANEWCRIGNDEFALSKVYWVNTWYIGCHPSDLRIVWGTASGLTARRRCVEWTIWLWLVTMGWWCISTLWPHKFPRCHSSPRNVLVIGITNVLKMMNTSSTWRSRISRWRNVHDEAHWPSWASSRRPWSCTKCIQ